MRIKNSYQHGDHQRYRSPAGFKSDHHQEGAAYLCEDGQSQTDFGT